MATLRIIFLMTISVSLADNQVNVAELQKIVSNLQATVNTMESKMNESMKYHISALRGMTIQNNQRTDEAFNEVTGLKNKLGAGTALFSVYLTGDFFYPIGNQLIPFRGVTLNQGGHYSLSTFKFTCPKRGYYFFTFSIHSSNIRVGLPEHYSTADVVLDGQTMARSNSYNNDPNQYITVQGGNSVVVDCPQGGQVWLRSPYGKNKIAGSKSSRYSTFSGFLLSYM